MTKDDFGRIGRELFGGRDGLLEEPGGDVRVIRRRINNRAGQPQPAASSTVDVISGAGLSYVRIPALTQ
jgi:hypothetical protein